LPPPRSLAVAASAAFPDLLDDWPLLRHELAQVGITASTQVWTDRQVQWDGFDLVLANGAWDNIHHPSAFLSWAQRVAEVTLVVNPAATLRWNMDKRYLAALSEAGVPIVPTVWLDPSDGRENIDLPSGEFVVKPTISGGGFESARYGPEELATARAHVARLLAAGSSVMMQPYQAVIDTQGETGLIFLGGQFSHAIAKNPLLARGVGVQSELWRNHRINATVPSEAELATAHAALTAAHDLLGPTTYARVDLVPGDDGAPLLLELELLDPALYLDTEPAAPLRFAEVLARTLQLPSG
jgi:hypothetical protein